MQVDLADYTFSEAKRAFCREKDVVSFEKVIPVTFRGHACIKGFFCGIKDGQAAIFVDHRLFLISKDHALYLIPGFLKTGKIYF